MNGLSGLAGTFVPSGAAGWLAAIGALWVLVIILVVPWKGMAAGRRVRREQRKRPPAPLPSRVAPVVGTQYGIPWHGEISEREARQFDRIVWGYRHDGSSGRAAQVTRRLLPDGKRRIARRRKATGTRTGRR